MTSPVVRIEPFLPTTPTAPLPPPRRVRDAALRAPVPTGSHLPTGNAVAVRGLPEMACLARRWVRQHGGLRFDEAHDLALLTTEVFNNAVLHSRSGHPGGEVVVTVAKTGRTVQVKVTDQGPRHPGGQPRIQHQPTACEPCTEGGFGLQLLETMANRWGTALTRQATVVWFEIDRRTHRADQTLQTLRAHTSTPTSRPDGTGCVSRAGTTGGTGATGGANRPDGPGHSDGPA